MVEYRWKDFALDLREVGSIVWKPALAVALALSTILVLVPKGRADAPIPYGLWSCDTNGNCVNPNSVHEVEGNIRADALIYENGVTHRATLVRNCATGATTTIGVAGVPEDWRYDNVGLPWLCDGR